MSRLHAVLPDESRGWILWSGRREASQGRELPEVAGAGSGMAVGVPATLSTTFAVRLPTTDASLFPGMARSQIEKRGLARHGDASATPHAFHVIEQEGHETLLSVDVLAEDFPETLCLPQAAGYAPAARLLKLPEDKLLLWQEHKRLVLAVNKRGLLVHAQALSAEPELTAATAQEINLITLSLQAEGLAQDAPELVVAGGIAAAEGSGREAFAEALLMPAEFLPEPVSPAAGLAPLLDEGFLPHAVRRARARRGTARRLSTLGAAAAAAYVAGGFFLWQHASATEAKIAALEARVAETRPGVAAIQETESRWRELEPAFDLRYFPVVQLNEITKAMPGSGVLLRDFQTRGRQVTVNGQARDVQMAFRLKEDLEASGFFSSYSWNMPQPRVERNNIAAFQIQGQPRNEGAE